MRGNIKLYISLVLFAFLVFHSLPVHAVSTETLQGRFGADIRLRLDKNVSLAFEEEYRLGNENYSHYFHTQFGVAARLSKCFDAGVFYRQIFNEGSGSWQREYVAILESTFKWSWNHVGVSDRNRFEYRARDEAENGWEYRNKMKVFFPLRLSLLGISPYVADEIFVKIDNGTFYRNRIFAGSDMEFTKTVGLDLYYFWEHDRDDPASGNRHVIGTKLKLDF